MLFIPIERQKQLPIFSVLLTNNLEHYCCFVFHVFNLHLKLILPRVFSLCLADEEDRVNFTVPNISKCGIQGLPFFAPCDLWPGFTLHHKKEKEMAVTQSASVFVCKLQILKATLQLSYVLSVAVVCQFVKAKLQCFWKQVCLLSCLYNSHIQGGEVPLEADSKSKLILT